MRFIRRCFCGKSSFAANPKFKPVAFSDEVKGSGGRPIILIPGLGCPGSVWDETVAFLLVLFFTPVYSYWQLLAFALFRFFDIAKPPPIRYYERKFKGGFGVMIDDLLAAGYTLIVLAFARAILN